MKRILCFGDSNTWGYADSGQTAFQVKRYPEQCRWPCVAGSVLGDGFEILEEGLNGRSTNFSVPTPEGHNGLVYLEEHLADLLPVDAAVVALGINDLHPDRCGDVQASREAMAAILDRLKAAGIPHVILVLPALLNERICWPPYQGDASPQGAVARSRELHEAYRTLAAERGLPTVDAAVMARAGEDGLHLTRESHVRLGRAVAAKLAETLGGPH